MKNTNQMYRALLSGSAIKIPSNETISRFKATKKYLTKNFGIEYFYLLILASENMAREYTESSLQDVIDGKYKFKGIFKKLAKKCNFYNISRQQAFEAFSSLGFQLYDEGLQMYAYKSRIPRELSPMSVITTRSLNNLKDACNTSSMNEDFSFDAVNYYYHLKGFDNLQGLNKLVA